MLQNVTSPHTAHPPTYSYKELIHLLHKLNVPPKSVATMQSIDQALGSLSKQFDIIHIVGTHGKNITSKFAQSLFTQEHHKSVNLSFTHIDTYTTQIYTPTEHITTEQFTQYANTIIHLCKQHSLQPVAQDILVGISLLFADHHKASILILQNPELQNVSSVQAFTPCILSIPDLASQAHANILEYEMLQQLCKPITSSTYVLCADQSKHIIQTIQQLCVHTGAQRVMPVRKHAPLPYPYNQLYGKYASLAQRMVEIYMKHHAQPHLDQAPTLLTKPKQGRGRPKISDTLSTKQPNPNIDFFWQTYRCNFPFHFQILQTSNHRIVLDTSNNIESIKQLLLGIKLLHYQKPAQHISIIIGSDTYLGEEQKILPVIRSFFKGIQGEIIFISQIPGFHQHLAQKLNSHKALIKYAHNMTEAVQKIPQNLHASKHIIAICGQNKYLQNYVQHILATGKEHVDFTWI